MAAISSHVGYRSGDSAASQRLERFRGFSSKIKNIADTFDPRTDLLSADLEKVEKDSWSFSFSNFIGRKSDLDYHSEALNSLLLNFTAMNQAIVDANGHHYTSRAQTLHELPQGDEMVQLMFKIGTLRSRILADPNLGNEKNALEPVFNKLNAAMHQTQAHLDKAARAQEGQDVVRAKPSLDDLLEQERSMSGVPRQSPAGSARGMDSMPASVSSMGEKQKLSVDEMLARMNPIYGTSGQLLVGWEREEEFRRRNEEKERLSQAL